MYLVLKSHKTFQKYMLDGWFTDDETLLAKKFVLREFFFTQQGTQQVENCKN